MVITVINAPVPAASRLSTTIRATRLMMPRTDVISSGRMGAWARVGVWRETLKSIDDHAAVVVEVLQRSSVQLK